MILIFPNYVTANQTKAAGAFTPVALVFLGGLIGGALINIVYPVTIWPGTWIRLLGLVPLVAGVGLFASARVAFRRHHTALMPWTPSSQLVRDGPYGFTRNPIYLAFGMMYLGVTMIFDSAYLLVLLVIILVLFDRTQIPREERYLEETFGEEFRSYKAKVRRWI